VTEHPPWATPIAATLRENVGRIELADSASRDDFRCIGRQSRQPVVEIEPVAFLRR
jgi:hypothetical protein